MNRITTTLVAGALLGLAGLATANEDATVVKSTTTTSTQATSTTITQPDFATLDENNDGAIVLIEVAKEPMLSTKFANYDLDRDGKLSPIEFDDYIAAEIDPNVDIGLEVEEDD